MSNENPCPFCGAVGDEHCASSSGRDHPSRARANAPQANRPDPDALVENRPSEEL